MPPICAFQSSGIIWPVRAYQSQLAQSMGVMSSGMPKRCAAPQHAQALGHHFLADAIAGDGRDLEGACHGRVLKR
jgi:hypothetical protein